VNIDIETPAEIINPEVEKPSLTPKAAQSISFLFNQPLLLQKKQDKLDSLKQTLL
jgi:hypothetical protein